MADQGYAPNVGRGGDAGLADFSAGKAAMTLGSTASLKQILNDVNGKFEVGTACLLYTSQRPHIHVPGVDKGIDRHSSDRRLRKRNQNPEDEFHIRASVDLRRFIQ